MTLAQRIAIQWIVLGALVWGLWRVANDPSARAVPQRRVHEDGREVVTLWMGTIMGRWDELAMREAIRRFNDTHREIFIDAKLMPATVYGSKVNLAVASGRPPDVVYNADELVQSNRQRSDVSELVAPIPESMISAETRAAWGPAILRAIRVEGKIVRFPDSAFLNGMLLRGNLDYFREAGVDIEQYLEHGWDYETFTREMTKVQEAARRMTGREVYAFGLNLANAHRLLYTTLLPPIIGAEARARSFLEYDERSGRYRVDPAITVDALAAPLRFMQDLIHKDGLWGRKYLGMDFGQIGVEMFNRLDLVSILADTPGYSIYSQLYAEEEIRRGVRERPFHATNIPAPTPRAGMAPVFSAGANGWGVMRRIPPLSDAHTRAALEVARYVASPEVQALVFRMSKVRIHLWPDDAAVAALVTDVEDPIAADAWLSYLWGLYKDWMKNAATYHADAGDWPDPATRKDLLIRMGPDAPASYLTAGMGKQILEAVLFNQKAPEEAARELLAGMQREIDEYYARNAPGAR